MGTIDQRGICQSLMHFDRKLVEHDSENAKFRLGSRKVRSVAKTDLRD